MAMRYEQTIPNERTQQQQQPRLKQELELEYPEMQKHMFPIVTDKEKRRRDKFLERRREDLDQLRESQVPAFWINGTSQASQNKLPLHPFEQLQLSGTAGKVETKNIFIHPPETAKYALLTKQSSSKAKNAELILLKNSGDLQLTLLQNESAVVTYTNNEGYPISYENVQ